MLLMVKIVGVVMMLFISVCVLLRILVESVRLNIWWVFVLLLLY